MRFRKDLPMSFIGALAWIRVVFTLHRNKAGV